MSDQYTPTTEEVRDDYVAYLSSEPEDFTGDPIPDGWARGRFQRWLANIKAEAWQQGADSAYYDPEIRDQVNYPDNPYRKTVTT